MAAAVPRSPFVPWQTQGMKITTESGLSSAQTNLRPKAHFNNSTRCPFALRAAHCHIHGFIALNIFGNLPQKALALLKPLAERFDKAIETFAPLGLR